MSSLYFFIFKDNYIWVMTRYHVNNILLTRDLPFVFVSDSRQWSHPLMIPMHCLWAKSNHSLRSQFKCAAYSIWMWSDFEAVRLKLGVQGQASGRILEVAGQGGERSWKLDNFHGHHVFIVPNAIRFAFATSYIFPSPFVLQFSWHARFLGALFVLILSYLVSKRRAL